MFFSTKLSKLSVTVLFLSLFSNDMIMLHRGLHQGCYNKRANITSSTISTVQCCLVGPNIKQIL